MARQPATRSSANASRRIVALAERQHGVFSVAQLDAIGIGWEIVRRRTESGWLHRVHRGVYAVGGSVLSHRGRWLAAVLACGPDSALSDGSAAALWRLNPPSSAPVDVSVRSGAGRDLRAGISIHRRVGLRDDEITARDRIPVTTPPRTILDLATALERRSLERVIDEAEYLGLCGADELRRIVARHRGRAGTSLLAGVLSSHEPGTTRTRTELEEMFLALCRDHALEGPLVNAPLLGLTVDFYWPPAVVVEVDGGQSHLTRRAFQDDRDRDSLLTAHGYTVVRFTWWDVERRPAVVADRVRRLLARNGDR